MARFAPPIFCALVAMHVHALSLSRRDRHRPRREPHGDSDNDDGPKNDLAAVERKRVPKGKSWATPSPVARPLASTQAEKPNSRLQALLSRVTGEPAGTPHADDDVIFASSSATAQPLHAVTEEDTSRHAPVSTPNRPSQQRDSLPTSPTPSGDFSQVRNSQPLYSLGPVAFTRPCGSDASGAVPRLATLSSRPVDVLCLVSRDLCLSCIKCSSLVCCTRPQNALVFDPLTREQVLAAVGARCGCTCSAHMACHGAHHGTHTSGSLAHVLCARAMNVLTTSRRRFVWRYFCLRLNRRVGRASLGPTHTKFRLSRSG